MFERVADEMKRGEFEIVVLDSWRNGKQSV